MKLSIITVTWNSREDILRLIASIQRYVTDLSYEIIVVDNNSSDGTVEAVRSNYPHITVVAHQHNAGYAGGMNAGYARSSGEYLCFMNPDMELTQDCFTPLINRLERDASIGLIAPQLRYADGSVQPTVKGEPSLISQILIMLKLHHIFTPAPLQRYFASTFDYTHEQEVRHLMGAFVMTTRDRFEQFGPWDERYPLWWEDEQLSLDSRKAGFSNLYTPITSLTHFEGKSFAQVLSLTKQRRFNKGMRLYFLYNKGVAPYLLLCALHPFSLALAWLSQTARIRSVSQSTLSRK